MQTTILPDTSEPLRHKAAPNAERSFRTRVLLKRNRLLSNSRVIAFLERFPLTRPVARREASALFDLCSGFVYSQVLFACVELQLFELLSTDPLTKDEIAVRLNLSLDVTARLLTAAEGLRLVESCGDGRFTLGTLGAAFLASPGLGLMVSHHALLYRDLSDPVALLAARSVDADAKAREPALPGAAATNMSAYWPYAGMGSASSEVTAYTTLMAATQPSLAAEILDAVPFQSRASLLDVGGGDGAFISAAAQRHITLKVALFDLPEVASLASRRFDNAGLGNRVAIHGGDFKRDPLPAGSDTVTLIRVLLDHDDATCLALLRSVRVALPPGGQLIVAEPMAKVRGAARVAAYFSFYLMAMGRGRPRTERQLRQMLASAGFSGVRKVATRQPLLTQIFLATV